MQAKRRKQVAVLVSTTDLSIKDIATKCDVSLKIAYNVKSRVKSGETLDHQPGAGPKSKLTSKDRISLALTMKHHPRISLRMMSHNFKMKRA